MFAFIDPYSTTQLAWETLAKLANFKRESKYKVELWILFLGSAIPRIHGLKDPAQAAAISRLFGSDEWVAIASARDEGTLTAEQARYEYTNLMRWRVEKVLGYQRTHTLEVKNTSGAYIYDLIFATDNNAGDKIMSDIYRSALTRNERMRREAVELRREKRTEQPSLFSAEVTSLLGPEPGVAYVPEPPTPPFGSDEGATRGGAES